MPLPIKLLVGALFLAYPFIIYYGLLHFALWQLAAVITVIAGLRLFVFKDKQSILAKVGFYSSLFLIAFSIISAILDSNGWLKLYPIVVSSLSLVLFFSSLFSEKSAIQRIAEIKEKNIDAKKQKYMRNLTKIWCAFFVINILISAYTMLFMSLKNWTIYNGFVSYILMGTLVVFELLYRHLVVLKRVS